MTFRIAVDPNAGNKAVLATSTASLLKQYEKIPSSKCLHCPKHNHVIAQCCRKAAPPLYFIEFMNVYNYVWKNWSKEDRKNLFYKCYQNILSTESSKPCIFLDLETNKCQIYKERWINCRTYGMTPNVEWEDRAKFWVKDTIKDHFVEKQIVKEFIDSKLTDISGKSTKKEIEVEKSIVNQEKLGQYIKDLFTDGLIDNIDRINDKLNKDFGVKDLLYLQCKNLEIDNPILGLDDIYNNIVKIESDFVGYDITKDKESSTYLAIHIYFLLAIVGKTPVEFLVRAKDIWNDAQKADFLENIVKKNLDNLTED